MLPRQPIYDRHFFFSENVRSHYNLKLGQITFIIVTFMFLVHISVPLLVLITFLPLNSPPRLALEEKKKELGVGLFSFPDVEYLGLCGYCLVG